MINIEQDQKVMKLAYSYCCSTHTQKFNCGSFADWLGHVASCLQKLTFQTNLTVIFLGPDLKEGHGKMAEVETLDGCYEITSLVGTVCADGAHLHVTLGSSNGSTVAGHVVGDLIVQTTAEIVLADAVKHKFNRVTDMATGWPELIVSK